MEDLSILLHHVDCAEFPDLTIEEIVEDVWDMVNGWCGSLPVDFLKYKIVRDVRDTDLATGMREIHLDCPTMAAFMTEENVRVFLTNLERVLGREPVDQSAGRG